MCELHPSCSCINPPAYRLTSDFNPACTPSSSSSVEAPNCGIVLLNSDVNSPNSSLESVFTVQSEKILQNNSAEETKTNKSEMYENEIDDNSVENDEILTAVPLDKFLQFAAKEETEFNESGTISENCKESSEIQIASPGEHSCNDWEKQNKNNKKCQKVRIKIAIENNGQTSVTIEKSDGTTSDKALERVSSGIDTSEKDDIKNEVMADFVPERKSSCNDAKENMLLKHFNSKGELLNYNIKKPIPVDQNNNKPFSRLDENEVRMPFSGTVDSKQKSRVEEEKPVEFVVKRVESEAETMELPGRDSATDVLTLVPMVVSPASKNSCREVESDIKMDEKDSGGGSVGKKSCSKVKNYHPLSNEKNEQQTDKGRIVVPRPLPNTVYPLGIYSPILDRNYQPERKDKNQISKRCGLQPVSFHWPLNKSAKKRIKEEEQCETNNNVRVRRKIIRLSSEPVKMYRISGGTFRKPDKAFEEKGPTPDSKTVYPGGAAGNSKVDQDETKTFKKRIDLNQRETSILRSRGMYNIQDILLAACQDLKNISDKEDSLNTSESPFCKSDMDIESNISLEDIDVNKICDEDFFSTELFAPIYPSNPLYGDGSDKDPDLEKIENDIFELQDKYSTSVTSFSSLLPDQTTLPVASVNAQNSTVLSGFNPNVLSVQPQGVAIGLNSSNQASVSTGIMGQAMSLDSVNVLTSVPASVNVVENTTQGVGVPLVFSTGGNIQSATPTVQVSTNLMQCNVQSAVLPTVLSQNSGTLPAVSTVQGTIQQAPVQVPSAFLHALKQGTSSVTANQTTQSVLLQQLSTLISNHQSNVQLGTQNTSVVNNIQQMNPSNTVQLLNLPVNTVLSPSASQSNLPKVHVQNIPQLSEVTFGDIASIQNDNPSQIKMDAVRENQGTYPGNSAEVTNAGVISNTVAFSNHVTAAGSTNILNNFVASNLNTVNQTSVVIDGNSTQSNLQPSVYVTGTDGEMMDTSQDANSSLTETETIENQSEQNLS